MICENNKRIASPVTSINSESGWLSAEHRGLSGAKKGMWSSFGRIDNTGVQMDAVWLQELPAWLRRLPLLLLSSIQHQKPSCHQRAFAIAPMVTVCARVCKCYSLECFRTVRLSLCPSVCLFCAWFFFRWGSNSFGENGAFIEKM